MRERHEIYGVMTFSARSAELFASWGFQRLLPLVSGCREADSLMTV